MEFSDGPVTQTPKQKIYDVLAERTGIERDKIHDTTELKNHLDLDSLEIEDIIIELEYIFKIVLNSSKTKLVTVGDLCNFAQTEIDKFK